MPAKLAANGIRRSFRIHDKALRLFSITVNFLLAMTNLTNQTNLIKQIYLLVNW